MPGALEKFETIPPRPNASSAPARKTTRLIRRNRLKNADWEANFFLIFMDGCWMQFDLPVLRQSWPAVTRKMQKFLVARVTRLHSEFQRGGAATDVAQSSKSAADAWLCRFGKLRYSRFGTLRYY